MDLLGQKKRCSKHFFAVMQEIYTFFSSPTESWAVLLSFLNADLRVPKYLSNTRWEAHIKSESAISEGYRSITDALSHHHTTENEKGDKRRQTGTPLEKMEELGLVFMLHLWTICWRSFTKPVRLFRIHRLHLPYV